MRRDFARQANLRSTVVQARKSLMLRELASGKADMKEDDDDASIPSGLSIMHVCISSATCTIALHADLSAFSLQFLS